MFRWLSYLLFFLLSAHFAGAQAVWDRENLVKNLEPNGDTLYVFNFWATWCKPCVEELPEFKAAQLANHEQPVRFVFVSLDFLSQRESRLLPFVNKNLAWADVVQLAAGNPDEWIPLVDSSWSGAIPATLFFSRNKRLFFEGSVNKSDIQAYLKQIKP